MGTLTPQEVCTEEWLTAKAAGGARGGAPTATAGRPGMPVGRGRGVPMGAMGRGRGAPPPGLGRGRGMLPGAGRGAPMPRPGMPAKAPAPVPVASPANEKSEASP